ncbi:MAG: hypothetical protein MMC23_006547 [Stictis urceolatum]|nr:hypothetical protein [Stictis urceolata]
MAALVYHTNLPSVPEGYIPPDGTITEVWWENKTFAQSPNILSEQAWDELVPVGKGFIHHPELAPFISNLAVFHQLHCLHSALAAYYDALENSNSSVSENGPQGTRITPTHVSHCFDYLRRSIMCAADTNLEVVDHVTRTTNGWGREKKCRDYAKVVEFAERWANSTDRGIKDEA